MTNKEILKLARTYGFSYDEDEQHWMVWEEELIEFFLAAHQMGYNEGYTKGFKVGHDAGWELNDEVSHRRL